MKNFIVFMAFLILGLFIAGIIFTYKENATSMQEKSKTAITNVENQLTN